MNTEVNERYNSTSSIGNIIAISPIIKYIYDAANSKKLELLLGSMKPV